MGYDLSVAPANVCCKGHSNCGGYDDCEDCDYVYDCAYAGADTGYENCPYWLEMSYYNLRRGVFTQARLRIGE